MPKRDQPTPPEAKANWRASVAKANNKPAGVDYGSHGEGLGVGWGGPATGMPDPEMRGRRLTPEQKADKQQRIAAHLDNIEHYALNADNEQLRVIASDKMLDRLEGKPQQRIINIDATDSLREWVVTSQRMLADESK